MRLRDLRTGEEREAAADVPPGATALRDGNVAWVWFRGETYRLSLARSGRAARGGEETPSLEAPMPGRIAAVRVASGASVSKGDVLVVVEAMKMEHAVRAPKDGAVKRVLVSEGQMVGLGDVLVEMA
ncbi:MAG TPA: biotin/lipoyl-containing protein [Thermoanaerobaculia bacterium]|nr:biotin/lipoyl-containing protein [Thermoanaerobaculia bacterium]